MIIEALITAVRAVVNALAGLFGSISMPGWWADLDGWLSTIGSAAAGFAPWVPWHVVTTAATFVVGCLGVAFGIKIVRIVASFFTAGGGSAA